VYSQCCFIRSADWLHASPILTCGTRFGNETQLRCVVYALDSDFVSQICFHEAPWFSQTARTISHVAAVLFEWRHHSMNDLVLVRWTYTWTYRQSKSRRIWWGLTANIWMVWRWSHCKLDTLWHVSHGHRYLGLVIRGLHIVIHWRGHRGSSKQERTQVSVTV